MPEADPTLGDYVLALDQHAAEFEEELASAGARLRTLEREEKTIAWKHVARRVDIGRELARVREEQRAAALQLCSLTLAKVAARAYAGGETLPLETVRYLEAYIRETGTYFDAAVDIVRNVTEKHDVRLSPAVHHVFLLTREWFRQAVDAGDSDVDGR